MKFFFKGSNKGFGIRVSDSITNLGNRIIAA